MNMAAKHLAGGQAEVHIVVWQQWQDRVSPIQPGTLVAIKHCHNHSGGGNFRAPPTKEAFDWAGGWACDMMPAWGRA